MPSSAGRTAPLANDARRLPVPAVALGRWLAEIDDLAELKATLRAVGILAEGVHRAGVPPSIPLNDLLDDYFLARGAGAGDSIRSGIAAALERGTLAAVRAGGEIRILLNDDAGRRYIQQAGLARPSPADIAGGYGDVVASHPPDTSDRDGGRANIFALYEQHIGPYGHNTAEQLRAAEEEYPAQWIEYAFATAVEHNARSWSYVSSILRRLVRDGLPEGNLSNYDNGKPGHNTAPDRRTGYLDYYRRRYGHLPWEPGEGDPADDEPGRNAA